MAHFDEMTCLLYLEGQLDRERALELSAHLETCAACRTLVSALESETRLLRRALAEEDEPVPARLLAASPEFVERDSIPWGWLAALGFAGAGAYTLWTGVVSPWTQQFDQAGFGGDSLLAMLFFGGVFWKGWQTMVTFTEMAAAATLIALTGVLLRRSLRRSGTLAAVLCGMVALLALPAAASAADIRHAQSLVVPAGEVIKNDLIFAGDSLRVEGTVEGDVIAFGRTVTVNGHVTGDIIVFAQIVRVRGPVDGNVRAFANFISISGPVAKNVISFCETFELESQANVGGSLTFGAARATQEGRVGRDLLAFVAEHELNGFVGGTATLHGDRLTIGPTAEIQGKATFEGHRQPSVSSQAKLAGPLDVKVLAHRPNYLSARYYWHQILRWGAAFVLGLVVVLLMPGFLQETSRAGDKALLPLGIGALTLIVTPIAAVIACVTIVGLALGIATVLLYIIAIYSAQVFAGAWLGQKVLGTTEGVGATIGRLALGLLIIRVLGMVPFVGTFVWLAVFLFGLGVLTLASLGRIRKTPAVA